MQKTEKYTLFLSRQVDINEVNVAGLWSYLAFIYEQQDEYFVQADITHTKLVCNEDVGCENAAVINAVKIISVRNPSLYPDRNLYKDTLIKIFDDIISAIGDVYAILEEQIIDFGFYMALTD